MCTLWFSPRELWGYWLVQIIVPPSGLQTSLASLVLSLAAPLGTLYSLYWLAVSHGYFDPLSNKDQSIHTSVFLLELHVVCELYLGHSELLG